MGEVEVHEQKANEYAALKKGEEVHAFEHRQAARGDKMLQANKMWMMQQGGGGGGMMMGGAQVPCYNGIAGMYTGNNGEVDAAHAAAAFGNGYGTKIAMQYGAGAQGGRMMGGMYENSKYRDGRWGTAPLQQKILGGGMMGQGMMRGGMPGMQPGMTPYNAAGMKPGMNMYHPASMGYGGYGGYGNPMMQGRYPQNAQMMSMGQPQMQQQQMQQQQMQQQMQQQPQEDERMKRKS